MRKLTFTIDKKMLTDTLALLRRSGPGDTRPFSLKVKSGPPEHEHEETLTGTVSYTPDGTAFQILVDEPR